MREVGGGGSSTAGRPCVARPRLLGLSHGHPTKQRGMKQANHLDGLTGIDVANRRCALAGGEGPRCPRFS